MKRQLDSGKVALAFRARASGTTFAVGKKETGRLREVWNGDEISDLATRPPKPPLLADPAGLIHLECSEKQPLWMSRRDAKVWFDQLRCPTSLSYYMGRPPVNVGELIGLGMTSDSIVARIIDIDDGVINLATDTVLTPVNATWAMGFSWSSYVAQSTMVRSCLAAGFPEHVFLTEAHQLPPPFVTSVCGSLAVNTDDITHFLRASVVAKRAIDIPPLAFLDEAWRVQGIEHQHRKSCDLIRDGTVLGIDLVEGTSLAPKLSGFIDILRAGADVISRGTASPLAVHSFLGKLHWNDLLNRCLLSCFADVYEFTQREQTSKVIQLPSSVIGEFALNLAIFPYWNVDLTRGWMDILPVTDASESFGLGLCVADIAPSYAREIASLPYDDNFHVGAQMRLVRRPSARAMGLPSVCHSGSQSLDLFFHNVQLGRATLVVWRPVQ